MKELKKYFLNSGMLITVVVAALFPFISNLKLIRFGRFTDYLETADRLNFYSLTFMQSGLFIPVLAGLPAATIICVELHSGYSTHILMRESKNRYILKSLIGAMLAGGVGVALPGIATGIIAMFGKAYTGNETYNSLITLGWMSKYSLGLNGNAAILIYIFTLFIFGCVWSTYAQIFAVLFKNIYVTLAAPFLTTFLLQILLNSAGLEKYAPMNMYGDECMAVPSMSFAMIYQGILFTIFAVVFCITARRRLDNE